MSYKYSVGDHVVVSTDGMFLMPRKHPPVLQAVIKRREPKPVNQLFPLYLIRFDPPLRGHDEKWASEREIVSRVRDYVKPTHVFYNVISSGPLFFLRTPLPDLPRGVFRKALTPILQGYGIRHSNVHAIETIDGTTGGEDADFVQKLQRAYAGNREIVKAFALYDWNGDRFVLARSSTR